MNEDKDDRWAVVERNGSLHVKPLRDVIVHTGSDCACKPKLEDGVWIHGALDGRES